MKWYLKMQNMFFFFFFFFASSDADALRAITLVRANIQPTFFLFYTTIFPKHPHQFIYYTLSFL